MGQKHQVFLIARITPHGQPLGVTRYRCIAALHDKWCFGRLPLIAAARFMMLIKQKENANLIRQEIHGLHGLYGTSGTPEISDVQCSFVRFLLHSAWTSDLNDNNPYDARSHRLPASWGTTILGMEKLFRSQIPLS